MAGGRPVCPLVGWFSNILKNSKSRFVDYINLVCTVINTLLIIVLYRHGIKCVITRVKYIVELKDRVLAVTLLLVCNTYPAE